MSALLLEVGMCGCDWHVRFRSLADIATRSRHVCFAPNCDRKKQTSAKHNEVS